jgi:hypothetical protein
MMFAHIPNGSGGLLQSRGAVYSASGTRRRLLIDNMPMTPHFWLSPVLVMLSAALFLASRPATVGARQAEEPVGWPRDFTSEAAPTQWTERSVASGGLRIAVSLPAGWVVSAGGGPGSLVAMDFTAGLRMEIAETIEAKFILDAPVSAERLSGSIKTMQAAAPAGYVVQGAGQVRINERVWLWHESRIPTFDVATAAAYQEMLHSTPYESARTWSFVATPHKRLVRVYFAALHPRGLSASEVDARSLRAGAVFAGMLRRMTFTAA